MFCKTWSSIQHNDLMITSQRHHNNSDIISICCHGRSAEHLCLWGWASRDHWTSGTTPDSVLQKEEEHGHQTSHDMSPDITWHMYSLPGVFLTFDLNLHLRGWSSKVPDYNGVAVFTFGDHHSKLCWAMLRGVAIVGKDADGMLGRKRWGLVRVLIYVCGRVLIAILLERSRGGLLVTMRCGGGGGGGGGAGGREGWWHSAE